MINRHLLSAYVLVALTLVTTAVKADAAADQLHAIQHERVRSLVAADLATARRLHADDFQLIKPRAGTLSKDQHPADIATSALDYLEWQPGEMHVRLNGDSAVIRSRAAPVVAVRAAQAVP